MEEILDIVIRASAMIIAFGVAYVSKCFIAYLKTKLDEKDAAKLDLFVSELVAAAEQMFKQKDPDGKARLTFVQTMLKEAGYEITDALRAQIESKVLEINLTKKAVKTEVKNHE